MPKRIVIIGAHAAGVDAASAARKTDRTAEITLITEEKNAGYSRCGLPFVIEGKIPSFQDLIVFPPSFYQMMKLNLRTETKVTKIDTGKKVVEAADKTGKTEEIPYDSLIIATGANAFTPPIKGREKQGILPLRTIEDGERIDKAIREGAKSAVVMGAGLIGLETAVALNERGLKVTVVEMLPQVLPAMLDPDMAKMVEEMLRQKGINILTGKPVEEFLGADKVTGIMAGGEQINADLFISAFGVRANVQLATDAGVAIGETRLIKTNPKMETNIKDVYAVGDCVESIHMVTQRPVVQQLGTVAVRQGKVAGVNAAGGYAVFPGVMGSAVTKLYDTQIGVTGLTETAAKRAGIETVTGSITSKTRADYYPGALPIKVKLVVEKESQRIIGVQIIGGEDVTQRINAISLAVQKQMTVRELAKADTAYAPPLNETWEPMVLAAEMALMKLR
ncbi:MAG: FAD-dependent oxidoreductase [Candidatus Bathyarchaeota archaeon]|nr:FAD-dependent oxidoreductase [Candidatus Bathyarchaeota archaeon]MCX8177906.1 FAD-dependent oxidoreductase [Candidatus Bathyarchaeota archaeon]MDW8194273.1 FAD-dependent oxidoreductase [Nitrososphaerota archaeon]